MKRLLPLLILLLLVLVLVPLLRDDRSPREPASGLPWQVERTPDGHSRVFGLTLGQSTFRDALEQHGRDMELAIIAEPGEDGALELFYSRFMAGMLSGRLILGTRLDSDTLMQMRERAVHSKVLDSGARRFSLDPADLPRAHAATIESVTFIPAADINAEVTRQRFGPPAERIRVNKRVEHLLYPDIGLDLILDRDGKEVLQYVPPRDFERLRQPLEQGLETEPTAAK